MMALDWMQYNKAADRGEVTQAGSLTRIQVDFSVCLVRLSKWRDLKNSNSSVKALNIAMKFCWTL